MVLASFGNRRTSLVNRDMKAVLRYTDPGPLPSVYSRLRSSTFRKYNSAASISSAIRPRVIAGGAPGFLRVDQSDVATLVNDVAI